MATSTKSGKAAATGKKAAATKTASKGKAPSKASSEWPDRIFAVASPHSLGGVSMFAPGLTIDASNVQAFESDEDLVRRSIVRLQEAGFEVLQASTRSINIAGSRALFEKAFSTKLVSVEREAIRSGGKVATTSCIDVADTALFGLVDTASSGFADLLEGVAIEQPYALQAPTAFAPPARYWHLDVPADVSLGCNADRAHRSGVTGLGIRIAMIDTGQAAHPFFTERGYRVQPTVLGPGTVDAHIDSVGHGTGESANIFSTAPDITLLPVKCANASGSLVNTTAAFAAAVALNPTVISCSWSRNIQNGPLDAAANALAAEIASAVNAGIIVCFSASNGGWGFPAQMPEVIAVGGVFMNRDGSMRASDYASGFMSNIYPGRRVPDVSGLVGMRPNAMYIMLPLSEGASIEVGNAGGAHPNGDETANNDGWAAFSGTSASCPQLAGVCALIKQACPRLTPAQVKDILMRTARDVTVGSSSPLSGLPAGSPAGVGPDNATGAGMVDAHRAVLLAKLRCSVVPLLPVVPLVPFLPPRVPITPLIPFLPPRLPIAPLIPFLPPRLPVTPLIPFLPPRLVPPLLPFGPGPGPGPGPRPLNEGMPMTSDDVDAIEQMLLDSKDPLI